MSPGLIFSFMLPTALTDAERRLSAALMRVNHAGELAAQALYHGQAFAARSAGTREMLLAAARSTILRPSKGKAISGLATRR